MRNYTLSDEQEEIISYWLEHKGAMQVQAAAGSGKTRVLTECVRQLLDVPKEKYKVLCLTFTNKAADEIKERLSSISGISDRSFIGTIHGFSLEIIKSFKHEFGYSDMPHIIERESDRKEILKDLFIQNTILNSFYRNIIETAKDEKDILLYFSKCLNFISEQKRKLVFIDDDIDEYEDWSNEDLILFKEYNFRFKSQNLIDYDDILVLAWKILTERTSTTNIYQKIYKFILVDEAQDLNFAQYELIKAICGNPNANIMMVGDANQSIHGYAGASKEYMISNFVKDFDIPAEGQKKINHNYRSSKAIIDAANLIIPNSTAGVNSFYKGDFSAFKFPDETQEANWVINKIHQLLNNVNQIEFEGGLSLDNIAILGRNRFVFNVISKQLDFDNILKNKYFLKRSNDSLEPESSFMKIFELGTRILTNKSGSVYVKQLLSVIKISNYSDNINDNSIDLLKGIKNFITDNSIITSIDYQQLINAWENIENNTNNVLPTFTELIKYCENSNVDDKILAAFDLMEWESSWKMYIRNIPPKSGSFSDFRRYLAMGISNNSRTKGITLATVHAVKGLEYDVVFLIGMGDGTFPDYRSLIGKALEEERNNAYVAVTRAKRNLYITYPETKTLPWGSVKRQDASRFLKEIELEINENKIR